jgi:hypothetical protein
MTDLVKETTATLKKDKVFMLSLRQIRSELGGEFQFKSAKNFVEVSVDFNGEEKTVEALVKRVKEEMDILGR